MAGKTLPQQLAIGSSYTFINSSQDPNKNIKDVLSDTAVSTISIYSSGRLNHKLSEKGINSVSREIISESTAKEIEYRILGNGESDEK